MSRYRVIVSDASPLITLAAAEALDKLTLPGLTVVIPDMVYFEVTRDLSKLGAAEVVRWFNTKPRLVEIALTQTYADFVALTTLQPTAKARNRGEEAAIEVLRTLGEQDEEFSGLLLFEDSDLIGRQMLTRAPERVKLLTTLDFLSALEVAGRIQSADQIMAQAVKRGRGLRVLGYDDPTLTAELAPAVVQRRERVIPWTSTTPPKKPPIAQRSATGSPPTRPPGR